ncbi:DNA alkylation repair protein [Flavobacterium sp. D11R37]|uniref:DNA alkylation repair protein n=1 Tax=Flavobacterium coralii TaxID=2838017 RepID=UPI001CA6090C|nr:DNA alkylation repair protein [Flavobacterium coralii]MBY8961271.1 DNA alkylation repair protein [Flavobacterium coralii]
MTGFIGRLQSVFQENTSAENAGAMQKYMKDNFPFLGIKTDLRRALLKQVWQEHKDEVSQHPRELAKQLYALPQREYHYCAIEILIKELKKKYRKEDVVLIEFLIVTHSWWDSVDVLAKYMLGDYLKQYPHETHLVIQRFSDSENMWLNRSAILFQLGYKKTTDMHILFSECLKHKHSKEFFIQKAIGWALREYGKTNPEAVRNFVNEAGLKPLSKREALKNL